MRHDDMTGGRWVATTWALALALTLAACSDDTQGGDPQDTGGASQDASQDAPRQDAAPTPDAGPADASTQDTSDQDADPAGEDAGGPPDAGFEEDTRPPDPDAFTLTALVPPTGPTQGGTRVRLVGDGLVEGTQVFLGGALMEVTPGGAGLVGDTPPALGSGPVTVKAVHPDGRVVALPDGFTYTDGLRLDAVTPSRVPTTGGVELSLVGEGFTPEMAVSVGGENALRVLFVDEGRARALAPPHPEGVVDVRVTTRRGGVVAQDAVTYVEALSVGAITPATGATAGGELVTIQAPGVSVDATVRIQGSQAQVVSVDPVDDTITVRTPPGAAGPADVLIESGPDAALAEGAFHYRADDSPQVLAVQPASGPDEGGVTARVLGYGFDAADARVTFAGADATLLESGATYALVRTPAGALGAADVALFDGASELARLDDGYTYVDTVWIDALSPSEGDVAGGDTVRIQGEGFTGAEEVVFGGVQATFTVVSDTEIEATAPAHGAGPVDVTVRAGEVTGALADGYVYTEPLEIWGFSPVRGAIAGGTHVAVRGRGFYGALSARVGGRAGAGLRRVDRNNLTFRTPPGAAGEARVEVVEGARRARAPYDFEYYNPASRFGGGSGAPVDGAVNVSVFDGGGAALAGAFVMLSTRPDTRYQGYTDANGQITLSGPDVLGAQTVTATAAGFSSTLIQAIDAEDITIYLTPTEPPPPNPGGGGGGGDPPPFGIVRGDVTTPGKLSDPSDQRTYDMVVVRTTQSSVFGGIPDPGPGSIVLGEGAYEIRTRIGDLAVVAMCGVYDERTDSFAPQFMAVERFLFISDRGEYDVDLDCDIPLDQELTVKLINPIYNPQGPDTNRVRAFWDFGFEGFFPSPAEAAGLSALLRVPGQPAFTGELADLTVTLIGGSYTGQFEPLTQTTVSGVSDTSRVIELGPLLDVPEPVRPLPGMLVEDNEIRWQADGPYYPDVTFLVLTNELGLPVWTVIVPGDQTSVRLPEFPDFSALPPAQRPLPYPPQRLFMRVTSATIEDFDFDAVTYEDLGADRWSVYARRRWAVLF
jgi:hypothetical protein